MDTQNTQFNLPQGQPPQGQPPQGQPPQGQPPQGQPPQGYQAHFVQPQGYQAQGQPPQGQPPQGYQAHFVQPQGYQAQGQPPQGQPPQGYQAHFYQPQGNQAQGSQAQGQLPQGYQAHSYQPQGNQAQGYVHGFQGNQPSYYGGQYSNAYMNEPSKPAYGNLKFSGLPFGGPSHHGGPANNPYPGYQAPGSGFQGSYDNSNNSQQQFGFAQTANPATDVHGNPSNPRGPGGEPAVKTARLSALFAGTRDQEMQSGADADEDQKRRDRIEVLKKEIAYNDVLIAQVQKIKDGHENMTKNMNKAWEDNTNATVEECMGTFNAIKRVLFRNQ
ncbi:hypothetical protein KC338_g1045 [Hortaea werneckii]|nr:hypothetical protein KC338_g1045 [Hortaea werneckii]